MNSKKIFLALFIVFTLPVFAQQPDMSMIPYRQGDLWGYSSPDKSIIIKPAFAEADWFYAGFAMVKKGDRYGYINTDGKLVIPCKFYSAKPFRYGYFDNAGQHFEGAKVVQNKDTVLFAGASQSADGYEICINTKGERMSRCPAINENSIPGITQTVVTTEKIYGLVNNGNLYDKVVDDYQVAGDENTYYVVTKNNMYAVINNKFEVIIPFEFSSLKKISIGTAIYLLSIRNGAYGIYQGNGKVYIPVENSNLVYVKARDGNDYCIISKGGKAMMRNFTGKEVLAAIYSNIVYDEDGGFLLTGTDNLKGFYFLDNKRIEPRYTDVKLVRGGRFLQVRTYLGKMGYVSENGTEYFQE